MENPFSKLINLSNASADARLGAPATNAAHCTGTSSDAVRLSDAEYLYDAPRTVIRGESPSEDRKKSQAALTDWLNVSFPFHPENNNPLEFFKFFSEVTKGFFGGMTDQQRGASRLAIFLSIRSWLCFLRIRRPK